MDNSIDERMRLLINELGLKVNSFSEKLGINPSIVHNIVSGRKSKPSFELLQKVKSSFENVNINWLITGEGGMFSDSIPQEEKVDVTWLDLPLLPVSPRAGFLELDDQRNEYDTVRVLCEAGDDYRHCVVAEVWGDSMEPTLPDRCRVVCRPMPPERWPWLSAGVYAISFGSSFVIKRIHQNRMSTEGRMELHSDNPTGGTLEVHTDDIRHMWRVETIVKATVK